MIYEPLWMRWFGDYFDSLLSSLSLGIYALLFPRRIPDIQVAFLVIHGHRIMNDPERIQHALDFYPVGGSICESCFSYWSCRMIYEQMFYLMPGTPFSKN